MFEQIITIINTIYRGLNLQISGAAEGSFSNYWGLNFWGCRHFVYYYYVLERFGFHKEQQLVWEVSFPAF